MKQSIAYILFMICFWSFSGAAFAQTRAGDKKKTGKKTAVKKTEKDSKKNVKKSKGNEIIIKGKVIPSKKENLLMKELKRKPFRASKTRRFEIIFFISLPMMLWLTYAIMEIYVSNVADRNNTENKLQTPHYAYILSTSLATSLYIAFSDMKRVSAIRAAGGGSQPREKSFTMPILGVRF